LEQTKELAPIDFLRIRQKWFPTDDEYSMFRDTMESMKIAFITYVHPTILDGGEPVTFDVAKEIVVRLLDDNLIRKSRCCLR
jgi:hypothetical protein